MANPTCPITGLQTIVLATDGSLHSEKALKEAVGLAKACASKIVVVSVIEINSEFASLAPQVIEKAEEQTRQLLDDVAACFGREGIQCETVIHEGEEAWRFIVDEATGRKADMIVMGTHGRSALGRLMMGSVAARVIGHAPCKVLVVPA